MATANDAQHPRQRASARRDTPATPTRRKPPKGVPVRQQETDEVRMELQPVIDLALWANNTHRPVHRTCPVCGTRGCDPYRWSHQILATVATFPMFVITRPTSDSP